MSRRRTSRCSAWGSLIVVCAGAALAYMAVQPTSPETGVQPSSRELAARPSPAARSGQPGSAETTGQASASRTAAPPSFAQATGQSISVETPAPLSSPDAVAQPSAPATVAPPGASGPAGPSSPADTAAPPTSPGTAVQLSSLETGTTPSASDKADDCRASDDCVDRYLWSLYERTPKIDTVKETEKKKVTVKRKGKTRTVTRSVTRLVNEDFAWKDLKAAQRVGLSPMEYVIGGMDPAFRLTLYHALRTLDGAGFAPGITSAFRDDYRQSIATGNKARDDRSYHGGSSRGGYGHGLAADIVSVRGATRAERWVSSEEMWNWIDTHGNELGIGRPYLDRDAPHVAPLGGEEYAKHRGSPTRLAGGTSSAQRVAARHSSAPHMRAARSSAPHVAAGKSSRPRALAANSSRHRVAAAKMKHALLARREAGRSPHARAAGASKPGKVARHGTTRRPAVSTRARGRRTHHANAAFDAPMRTGYPLSPWPRSTPA